MIDNSDRNGDWMRASWDLSPYMSAAFMEEIEQAGVSIDEFRNMPMYIMAVQRGMIVDDEWTGAMFDISYPWLVADVDVATQFRYRIESIFQALNEELSSAQADAGRALSKRETGEYLLNRISELSTESVFIDEIVTNMADVSGFDSLKATDQQEAWGQILLNYSGLFVRRILSIRLPQIWIKPGARATYYPNRNVIITPGLYGNHFNQLAHVAAHYIETIDKIGEVVSHVRNSFATPGTLHMIRNGLYALRGPWVDPFDGAIRGHDASISDWYDNQREFSFGEISAMFNDHHTEYFAMIAERVARGNPLEIADVWSRHPVQLLTYMAISAGHFMDEPHDI